MEDKSVNKVLSNVKNRIAFDKLESEEKMNNKNMIKKIGITMSMIAVMLLGAITVNAATDGAITGKIKAMIVKTDGTKEEIPICFKSIDGESVYEFGYHNDKEDVDYQGCIFDDELNDRSVELIINEEDGKVNFDIKNNN